MKPLRNIKSEAFTRVELVVVIVIVTLLAVMVIPLQVQRKIEARRNECANNLRQIDGCYRIWSSYRNRYPAQNSDEGGWEARINKAHPESFVWTNFFVMARLISLTNSAVVICPMDERKPAADFTLRNFHDNRSVSYFVDPNANDNYPQSILGGDRNLAATSNDNSYGYSPADGSGFDTATIPLPNNTTEIYWSRKMHGMGTSGAGGNIALGDGSVQQVTSEGFRRFLKQSSDASNPNSDSNGVVRLLLP